MATRKALVLVSGLFQELNSSSDKLDFAGNSTSDLSEGTNQYFTTSRARGSVSVASGSGLTYNSTSGEIGTSAIPNAQLANSAVTIGSTSVSLGATQGTFTGLTSLTSGILIAGSGANAISINGSNGSINFEGSTANDFETTLAVTDPTADRTITFPDNGGTVALTSDIVYPVTLTNSVTLTNKTLALGSNTISGTLAQFNTAVTDATLVSTTGSETLTNKSVNLANNTLTGTFAQFNTAVSDATLVSTTGTETLTNKSLTAPVLTGSSTSAGSIIFKEDTDNGTNSATLVGPSATADVTITLPAETGTVLTTASSIPNSSLANSSVTIGSTGVALGGSATTIAGLSSITSSAIVTDDNGFRIRDNSDNTKQLAFECSGISGSTTRTLTIPNSDGTIITNTSANFTDDVTFTGANHNIVFDKSDDALEFADNAKATFGAGNDLQIFHNGTDSFIDNTTGIFFIRNNNEEIRIRPVGQVGAPTDEESAIFKPNGAVELYYDNVKRFETSATGINITGTVVDDGATHDGDVTFTGASANVVFDKSDDALEFADNAKATFGTGADLSIFHNGNNSIIRDSGTGNLFLDSNRLEIRNSGGGETQAVFIQDGAVELYHDNGKKAETTATGFSVNGTSVDLGATHFGDVQFTGDNANIVFDKSDDALEFADNAKAVFGANGEIEIFRSGSESLIVETQGNNLSLAGNRVNLLNQNRTEVLIQAIANGSVELYHNNVKKAETSSTGFDIPLDFVGGSGGRIAVGASQDLTFFHDSTNSYVQNHTGDLILGDTNHQYFRGNTSDKSVSLYFNGSEKAKTTTSGISVTGDIAVSGTVDGVDIATLATESFATAIAVALG